MARPTGTPARRSTGSASTRPSEAIKLVKELKRAKFDESVEIHVRTGLNVRHADEQLRGTIALPHGLGKDIKIAVFARGDKAKEAEEAGADVVGAEDLADRVQNDGFTDFDVAIATPDMMPVVGRLGRILGPQGKMPNPKVGTVTMDVRKAVEESKAGKVEYRTDRTAIVHMTVGKTSFPDEQLIANYQAVIDELHRAKPSAAKGKYLRTIVMASTPGSWHQGGSSAHSRRSGGRSRLGPAFTSPKTSGSFVRPGQEEQFEPRPESRGHRRGDRPAPRGRGRVRRGLPRHVRAPGRRAAHQAA